MSLASWWSQPVAAEGSTASEGIRRQLGKPRLDPLEVLVRETAQNTCDAALDGHEVTFSIRLRTLSGNRLKGWRDFVLPEPAASALGLEEAMARQPLVAMVVDRGTTGLGGPLRADESPADGERPDFVNFIRNVGERKNLDLGGGSYGFGKGILYNVSRCHVIVVDTVCVYRGVRQRRLIGAALGNGYTRDGRRHTGRHWLGVHEADGHTRPLLDAEADDMATALGMPTFVDGATGTTIAVMDADLGRKGDGDAPRDVEEAAHFLASAMLWNLWPRMLTGRAGRLACSVQHEGFTVEVPDPESTIELAPFVDAYRHLSVPGAYVVPPRKSPPVEIGRFAYAAGMAPVMTSRVVAAAAPFSGAAHHCARMRHADLVVDYVDGEPTADEVLQYGAVFRASVEADQHFADAEPPTHDNWVTNGLTGTARGVVALANSFVVRQLHDRAQQDRPAAPVGDVPLGALASKLSGLLATEGNAAEAVSGTTRPSSFSSSSSAGGRPQFIEGPQLRNVDGRAVIWGRVIFPASSTPRTVRALPRVIGDGDGETFSGHLVGASVDGWHFEETTRYVAGDLLELGAGADETWELYVTPPPDAAVRIDLKTEVTRA